MKKTIIISAIVLMIFGFNSLYADSFNHMKLVAERFPTIEMPFVLKTDGGSTVKNIRPSDFLIKEEGRIVSTDLVSIDCDLSFPTFQLLFMIDQSTSMGSDFMGRKKMDWVTEALNYFFLEIDASVFSQIAIHTFSTKVKQTTDFISTSDIPALQSAANDLKTISAMTDFNVAFLEEGFGGIDALSNQANLYRVMVFITDGKHSVTRGDLEMNQILGGLQENDIQLFSYIISNETDGSISMLSTISEETGGKLRKNLDPDDMTQELKSLASNIRKAENCVLRWETDLYCDDHTITRDVEILFKTTHDIIYESYTTPEWSVFEVGGIDDTQHYFENPTLGDTFEKDIIITPDPWEMTINELYVESEEYFEIIDYGGGATEMPSNGISINEGSSHTIRVRFTPKDNILPRQTQLFLKADPCDKEVLLFGGEASIIANVDKVLYKCDDINITWTGLPSASDKDLYYKEVGTGTWIEIVKGVTGDGYVWAAPAINKDLIIKVDGYPIQGQSDIVSDETDEFTIMYPSFVNLLSRLSLDPIIAGETILQTFEDVWVNDSGTEVEIVSATVVGADAAVFEVSSNIIGIVQDGENIDIDILFTPAEIKKYNDATVELTFDCGKKPVVDINGEGVCGFNAIDFFDLGEVQLETDSIFVVDSAYYNPTGVALEYSLSISGTDKDCFEITVPAPEAYYSLASHTKQAMSIKFTPKIHGKHEAELLIRLDECDNITIPIVGYGLSMLTDLKDLDFGRERLKHDFETGYIIIENKDDYEKEITTVAFKDAIGDQYFTFDIDLPRTITGKEIYNMPIEFNPDVNTCNGYATVIELITNLDDTLSANIIGTTFLPELDIETICPEEGDDIATLRLTNPSLNSELKFNGFNVIAGGDEYVWINQPDDNLVLAIGETQEFTLRYTALEDHAHILDLDVLADNYDGTFTEEWFTNDIIFNCDAIFLANTDPNFDNVLVCSNYVTSFDLINKSEEIVCQVYCDQAIISGADALAYELLATGNIDVMGNSTETLDINFKPTHSGEHTATLTIPNSTDMDVVISLAGIGQLLVPTMTPNKTTYHPGDIVDLTFKLEIPELYNNKIEELDLLIRYDVNMISPMLNDIKYPLSQEPTDQNYMLVDELKHFGGELTVKANCSLDANQTHTLFTMPFRGLMTGALLTDVTIDVLYSCYADTTILGTVEREEVCGGDITLIEITDATAFATVLPNPAQETLTTSFNIQNDYFVEIVLIGTNGKKVKTFINQELSSGRHEYTFDISDVDQGSYMLILNDGVTMIQRKIIISK